MVSFDNFLKQFPNYTASVYEMALPFLNILTIKAGDYFLQQGNICKKIGFIESGLIRLYYINNGKEVTNCFCKENSIVTSYTSLLTQKESEISAQAVEDTELITLSYDSLQTLYSKSSFWQQVGRIASENEFMEIECHNRFLNDLSAKERYIQILENESDLLQRVPLNHLATYLQVTPETLSRIRKKITGN